MSTKVDKDIKAVAMIGSLIWIKSEQARSHIERGKLVGYKYISVFKEQMKSRTKELKTLWNQTPKKERHQLRISWVQQMADNSEKAKVTQLEIDMAREITRNM